MTANQVYIANSSTASPTLLYLPSSLSVGDTFTVEGLGSAGWNIMSSVTATQAIVDQVYESLTSTNTALATSLNKYDTLTISAIGTATVTVRNKNGALALTGVPQNQYLHSYWRMDETSGDAINAKDQNWNGVQTGGTIASSLGKFSNARGTFGAGAYFQVGTLVTGQPFGVQNFFMDFWYKMNVGDNSIYRLVLKTSDVTCGVAPFCLYSNLAGDTGGKIRYYYGQGNNYVDTAATVLNDGAWHYIAFGKRATSGANEIRIYVDGVVKGQASGVSMSESAYPMLLGGLPSGNAHNIYLDDISFWDTVPSSWTPIEDWISARYRAGIGRMVNVP